MPKRYINISEVTKDGKRYYRARLYFPFDESLGFKPEPKDFWGRTKEEADRKRTGYKPEKKTLDKKTSFIDYVESVFLPEQEIKADRGEMSWRYYENRRNRLKRFLIDPTIKGLADCLIRKVRLGALDPIHIDEFFKAVKAARIRQEDEFRLKVDLRAILKSARLRIPHKIYEYFDGLDVATLPKRIRPIKTFSVEMIYDAVTDEAKPIEYRCLAAFLFTMQCRPQEMFALEWDDLDLQGGLVTFYKKVVKTKLGWQVVDGTKTDDKGVRTVALPKFLVELLKQHKKERAMGLSGSIKEVPPFVFLTNYNAMLHKERWKDFWNGSKKSQWPGVRAILGLPKGPTFYSLKHLGNSFALQITNNTHAQSQKMGHTSDRMARQDYRVLMSAEKQQSADVFDNHFGGK
jgi:integrase